MLEDSLGFIQAPLNAILHAGNAKSIANNDTLGSSSCSLTDVDVTWETCAAAEPK